MKKILSSNKIYVSRSEIPEANRGVFAKVVIQKGETIETCPFIEIHEDDLTNIGESILATYIYFFGKKKDRLLVALGFGSLYNHNYVPNAVYKINPKEKIIEFISIKNIKKDEEISVNYNQGNRKNAQLWFE